MPDESAVDFGFYKPTAGKLLILGVRRVFTYVGPPAWGKTITPAQYDGYVAAGIEVQLVFEDLTNDASGGFEAGVRNAQMAELYLPPAYPLTFPVYFAVDEEVSGASLVTAEAYIAGASAVLGPNRTGDYGEGELLAATAAAGTAKWHWLSGSTSYPGSAVVGSEVDVVQHVPGPVDGTDADTVIHDPVDVVVTPAPPAPKQEEPTLLKSLVQKNAAGYVTALHVLGADPTTNLVTHRFQGIIAGKYEAWGELTVGTVTGTIIGFDAEGTSDGFVHCWVQLAGNTIVHYSLSPGGTWVRDPAPAA